MNRGSICVATSGGFAAVYCLIRMSTAVMTRHILCSIRGGLCHITYVGSPLSIELASFVPDISIQCRQVLHAIIAQPCEGPVDLVAQCMSKQECGQSLST